MTTQHSYLDNSKRWSDRGAEMRVLADEMRDDEARQMMLSLAED
jgi:outer membrane lipopolysaccharide assembly protein LptE/RlpB